MLINLRNALMAGKRLPYDAEVEYLQSTGTQYIDTGVVPAPMLDYSISFAFTSMSSYSYLMGAWSSNNSNYYDLAEQLNTLLYAGLGTTQQAIANIPVGVFSTVEKRGLEIYVDGVKKKTFSADIQSGSISSTILLFGVHRNYGPGYIVAAQPLRISAFSLKSNGVLVRDFVPVRKGTVGYMYDRVSGKLFGNAGTGDFVLGQDVVPVEYIESHGTEYINTGMGLSSNNIVRVRASFSTRASVFGAGSSGTRFNLTGASGSSRFYLTSTYVDSETAFNTVYDFICGKTFSIDGSIKQTFAADFAATSSCYLFCRNGAAVAGSSGPRDFLRGRIYTAQIYTGSTPVHSFRPVRVGTEGAMMDVLTRRIYRNAGTGAFGYGNDLKYPIPAE